MDCGVSVDELNVSNDLGSAMAEAGRAEFRRARLGGLRVRVSAEFAGEVPGGFVGSPMTLEEYWADRNGEEDG